MGLQTVRHDLVTEQQQQQQSWGVLVRSFVEWPSFRFIRCFLMIGLNLWVGGGKTSEVIYLAHWNWTKLGSDPPACSKANLTTPDCSEGNFSVCGKVPNAEPNKKNGQLMFKRPEDRNALQERVFKSKVKEQVTGWMISSCTSFSLAGGEVRGWYFWDPNYQASGSNLVYTLVICMCSSSSTWVGFQFLLKNLKDMHQVVIGVPLGEIKILCYHCTFI